MKGRNRRIGSRIVSLANISTLGTSKVRSSAFVDSKFRSSSLASRKLKYITRIRRVIEVTVEPPFVECVVDQRSNRSIVIRKSLFGDVKPPHAGVPEGCGDKISIGGTEIGRMHSPT